MEWTQIEIFKGIDLNDSFVLNWSYESERLFFELEASTMSFTAKQQSRIIEMA